MTFTPYIHFDGCCAEAMAFYAEIFGGTDMQMMPYSAAPADMGAPPSDRIMHSQFTVGGRLLMASDFPPGMAEKQQGMSVMVEPDTVDEARAAFDRLGEGGAPIMPFGPTFWSPGFGMVKDRFGTHWIIGAKAEG